MALTDNLVSYWKLDESSGNASDSVGSNTLTNSNVTYTTGIINNGALFDSTSDFLQIADGTQAGLDITGDLSYGCWINSSSLPASGAYQFILSKWASAGNQRGLHIYYYNNGGTLQFVIDLSNDGATADSKSFNYTLTTSTWYHIVFTFTAATSKYNLYINNSAQSEQTGSKTSIYNNTVPFSLGNEPSDTKNWKGTIDEVGIWSRALSSTEVTELYNSGSGIQYPFSTAITLVVGTMSLSLTYASVALKKAITVVADTMSLALTFADVTFGNAVTLVVDTMALTFSFASVTLNKIVKLVVDTMALVFTFAGVILNRIGWNNDTKPTSNWTEDSKPASSWTNDTK